MSLIVAREPARGNSNKSFKRQRKRATADTAKRDSVTSLDRYIIHNRSALFWPRARLLRRREREIADKRVFYFFCSGINRKREGGIRSAADANLRFCVILCVCSAEGERRGGGAHC